MEPSSHDSVTMAEMVNRVIDRGIVIDAEYRVDVLGVVLSKIDTHMVVASLDRYRELSTMEDALELLGPTPGWLAGGHSDDDWPGA